MRNDFDYGELVFIRKDGKETFIGQIYDKSTCEEVEEKINEVMDLVDNEYGRFEVYYFDVDIDESSRPRGRMLKEDEDDVYHKWNKNPFNFANAEEGEWKEVDLYSPENDNSEFLNGTGMEELADYLEWFPIYVVMEDYDPYVKQLGYPFACEPAELSDYVNARRWPADFISAKFEAPNKIVMTFDTKEGKVKIPASVWFCEVNEADEEAYELLNKYVTPENMKKLCKSIVDSL